MNSASDQVRWSSTLNQGVNIKSLITGRMEAPLSLTRGLSQIIQGIRGHLLFERLSIKLPSLPTMSLPVLKASGELVRDFNVRSDVNSLDHKDHVKFKKSASQSWRWDKAQIQFAPYSLEPITLKGKVALTLSDVPAQASLINPAQSRRSSIPRALRRLDLSFDLDPIKCQRIYNLTPKTLLGPITEAQLEGKIASKLRLTYRYPHDLKPNKDPVDISLKGFRRRCRFAQLKLNLPELSVKRAGRRVRVRDVTWLKDPFTYVIDPKWTKGEKIYVGPETQSFVSLSKLPSYVGGAMYLTEETGFWGGGAVSVPLLKRAINTNLKKESFVYGGSTITQQLVKNLFLHREKTLTRKFREVMISAGIVDNLSKRRVLELYLNVIEFGPKIFGIQRASRYYFQKNAKELTPEEAIFLAMLKVSPHRGPKWVRRGSSPTFTWWKNRSVQIFERLVSEGLISAQRAQGAAPFILRWSQGRYLGFQPLKAKDK